MDTKQLREIAGVPSLREVITDNVDHLIEFEKGDLIEALAIRCLEDGDPIDVTLDSLKEAYYRASAGLKDNGH